MEAADSLRAALPQAYQSDFAVYDMGFYLHHQDMVGGIPEVMAKTIDDHVTHSYYLVFGREMDREGRIKKVWVEVELPELVCFSETFYFGLIQELKFYLKNQINLIDYAGYYQPKAIKVMEEYINQTLKCCISSRSFQSEIDSGDISINLRHPDGPEWFFLSENDVALISDEPSMPQISFKLKYIGLNPEILDNMCYEMTAKLKITYLRPCISTGNGNNYSRNDSLIFSIENIGFELFYTFQLGSEIVYNELFEIIRGGRAKITILNNVDTVLGDFNFTIKGENPLMVEVFNYIDEKEVFQDIWFWKKMILTESGLPSSFGIVSRLNQFDVFELDNENLEEDWLAVNPQPTPSCTEGISV